MQTNWETLERIELPDDIANGLQRVSKTDEPPETLATGIRAIELTLADAGLEITVDQMYQPNETRHAVQFGDGVKHVPCALDALIAGLLVEAETVTIQSEPPNSGEAVQITVTETDVSVDPSTAVFSWGFAAGDIRDADPADAVDDDGTVSFATCSYINAFPDEATYRRWVAGLSEAIVMQLDIDTMVALAEHAAGGWVVTE